MVALFATAIASERTLHAFRTSRPGVSLRSLAVDRLQAGPVDVVFVGSSHIYTGVNPNQFDSQVVNLADSALNYEMLEVLCRTHWEHIRQAKLLVLELDAVLVYEDTLKRRNGDFRNFFDWEVTASELPLSPWETVKAVVGQNFTPLRFGTLWPEIIRPIPRFDPRIGPGFAARPGVLRPDEKDFFFAELPTTFDQKMVRGNLHCLKRLLQDLNAAGISWCMLRPPFHNDYWQHATTPARNALCEQAMKVCIDVAPIKRNCIIDCSTHFSHRDDRFDDWTHLSAIGANKLSEHLSEHLSEVARKQNL